MRKIVLFSVTCVTVTMLALGTYAASVDAGLVANGAPPPDPWEMANGAPPPDPWEARRF